MQNISGFVLFFPDDHFRAETRHRPLEGKIFLHAGVFHTHIVNGECGAVIKASHAVDAFTAVGRQPILHTDVLNWTDSCAAVT